MSAAFSLRKNPGSGKAAGVLVVLPDKGLDHPDGRDIFLYAGIQVVVAPEHFIEDAGGVQHNVDEGCGQHHDGCQKDQAQPGADEEAHDHAADEHQRGTHGNAQNHLIGILQVGDVCRQAGDKTCGAEFVDIRK